MQSTCIMYHMLYTCHAAHHVVLCYSGIIYQHHALHAIDMNCISHITSSTYHIPVSYIISNQLYHYAIPVSHITCPYTWSGAHRVSVAPHLDPSSWPQDLASYTLYIIVLQTIYCMLQTAYNKLQLPCYISYTIHHTLYTTYYVLYSDSPPQDIVNAREPI